MKRSFFKKLLIRYLIGGIICFIIVTIASGSLISIRDIHETEDWLTQDHNRVQIVLQIVYIVIYLIILSILLYYEKKIQKPLEKLVIGASQYAKGNMEYIIPTCGDDTDIDYLAKTMNYMAGRLAEKGEHQREFISDISHDLRTPVTSIKGYATALQDGTIPPELQSQYLNVIIQEAGRLENLSNSLLTLERLGQKEQRLTISEFDILSTIRHAASIFNALDSQQYARVKAQLPNHPVAVRADEQKIGQVLYQLLDNAVKFSPPEKNIEIRIKETGTKAFISVQDWGSGIPEAILPRIWERFYKSDYSRSRERNAAGLGLSVVQDIIRAHGQTIDVVSTQGVGTKFIFSLDRAV